MGGAVAAVPQRGVNHDGAGQVLRGGGESVDMCGVCGRCGQGIDIGVP